MLAAGDQGGEALDAELLGGEEIAKGLVAGVRAEEGVGEFLPVEARLLGHGRNLIGRGHIAVLGVEGLGDAAHEGQRQPRQQAPRRHHRAAGGLGVVDEGVAVEEREVEGLAAGGADACPGLADVVLVLGPHGRRVAGAQASHHHLQAHAPLEALGQGRDNG